MATTAVLDLKNFTPNIIKDQPLWEDFLDTVSDELDLVREEIELKQRLFETELYTDEAELIGLAQSLGYSPNLILKDNIESIRDEVDSIVFKIKTKGTYAYYNYLFNLIPREGQTYILFNDGITLARAIDYDTTFTNLNAHDLAKPFTGIRSILHYNEYLDFTIQLDVLPTPLTLDQGVTWYLDQDIIIRPTQHLALEYQIGNLVQNEEGEDVLITKDYLGYLMAGVEYGRKVTNIPHVGINISIPITDSGVANTLSEAENISEGTEAEQYTIPALKIWAATTEAYSGLSAAKYLAVGTGAKIVPTTEASGVLTDRVIHQSFENDGGDIFLDNVSDNEAIVIAGTHSVEEGISGKAIGWNGIDTEVEIAGVSIPSGDMEFTFWIKPETPGVEDPMLIYIEDYIRVFYDQASGQLFVFLDMFSGSPYMRTSLNSLEWTNRTMMVSIVIEEGVYARLYVDLQQGTGSDISSEPTTPALNNESIFLGCNATSGNLYTGMMDEFRIHQKVLTGSERSDLYYNRLGSLNYMANEVYRKELSHNQIGSYGDFEYAVGTVPVNTISNEILFSGDGSTITYNGTLEFPDISPGYVIFNYYSFPDYYTAKANERGEIYGDAATGTIDFETGIFELITYRDYTIGNEVMESDSVTTIDHLTEFENVVPSSAVLQYTINGTSYLITDDGAGNFVDAPTLTSATINYVSGQIDVEFTSSTEAGVEVEISYKYRMSSTPTLDTSVTAEYKLLEDLKITEAAILDSGGRAIVYASIPAGEYDSVVNHTGFQFFVKEE